jgi:alpha-N-acetylglucosaminidase
MMQEWRDGGNASGIQALGVQIVQNLQDIDRVVSTNYDFMFAAWISDARKWSDDPVVKDFYEYQARNQISSWGPLQPGGDEWRTERYASRQWAGLLGEF